MGREAVEACHGELETEEVHVRQEEHEATCARITNGNNSTASVVSVVWDAVVRILEAVASQRRLVLLAQGGKARLLPCPLVP